MSACVAGRTSIGPHSHRGFSGLSGRVVARPVRVTYPRKRGISVSLAAAVRSAPATTEKLEGWMRESVGEIVRSLGRAGETRESALLVQVYGGGGGEEGGSRIRTERARAGDWEAIQGRWRGEGEAAPEGIILVEELKDEEDEEEMNTKAWGVVLMGRGEEGGVASFLLKTTRGGRGGLSCNCTHFSLVRVNSFTQSTRSQLCNSWLVQAP